MLPNLTEATIYRTLALEELLSEWEAKAIEEARKNA